jgi:hypothetical protein
MYTQAEFLQLIQQYNSTDHMYFMEMFWDMFDMLPESKQKIFIKQAKEIEKNVRITRT